ncbi:hypothetical protein EYZ11_007604 [Aspergillus tanneri]|uniref:C2H2-type domain-containing protein n=1 Tax=Aspergillus tanneri TaxID=1220188 RepID=A0A4S3JEU5_9EURO|nr:hypothetical protein EYZ11_007604 [Aspergillus tanneri]
MSIAKSIRKYNVSFSVQQREHCGEESEEEARRAKESEDNTASGLDPRIEFIIERFAPYDGMGMAQDRPTDREYSCPDCDFKFRTLIENVLLPLDWKLYKWESVCKKCGQSFPSDADMKQHELTHHYEWHDDMEYRMQRDNALRNAAPSDTDRDYDEIYIPTKTTDLGHGILHCPDGHPHRLPPRGDRQIVGLSFISAEDIENHYAPQGKFKIPDGGYLSVPPWVSDSMIDEAMEKLHLGREQQDKMRIPLKTSEDEDHSAIVMVKGHGRPGAGQVTDASGRVRWLEGDGYGQLMQFLVGGNEYASYMKKAIALQADSDIKGALHFYLMALNEASTKARIEKDMDEYIALTSVGGCYTRLHDFDNTVDYNIRALCLAERLLGKDNPNLFLRINDLAVAYEEHGLLHEAHHLYLRSLSGKMRNLGESNASTLMTMQELGNIKRLLNNLQEAQLLLERAYLGYENLQDPNEEMACGTLFNITAVYKEIGLVNEAKALLEQTIPRMQQELGLANQITAGSIYNFILMEQTFIPAAILAMIQQIQEKRYETGRPVLELLARHYYNTHQIRKAVGLMRTLAEWEGMDIDQSMSYLSLAGACYSLLDDFDESCEMYELMHERAALTVQSQRQALRDNVRMCIWNIRSRQQQLLDERLAWGLDEPRPFCGLMHFCTPACENDHAHECRPTVTPKQQRKGTFETGSVPSSLEKHLLRLFAQDPIFARKPKPLRAEQIFLNPEGFATFRIWMDPTKLISFSFPPSADLRCWIVESDGTKVFWTTQEKCSDCYFYKDMGKRYLVVAPGADMMTRIVKHYRRDTGMGEDACQVPGRDIQEYLQVNEGRGGGTAMLALVMVLWEQ